MHQRTKKNGIGPVVTLRIDGLGARGMRQQVATTQHQRVIRRLQGMSQQPTNVRVVMALAAWQQLHELGETVHGWQQIPLEGLAIQLGVAIEMLQQLVGPGLLPQGVHTYRVNTHLPGHGEDRQMGCLRQDSATPVIRARTHLNYSLEELWDPLDWRPSGYNENSIRVIHANLHSATNRNSPPFASAACTTISGRYDPKPLKAIGAFEAFQAAMDIKIKPDGSGSTRDNEVFKYMLVTGREARLHRKYLGNVEKLKGLRRLRIGSAGVPVAKLRKHLYGAADTRDVIDGAALQKLVQSQGAWAVARDGMWTPELDAAQAVKAWEA